MTSAYIPADLRLEGGSLRYDVMNGAHATEVVAFPKNVLARSFGVLGICAHGLPASHNPMPNPVRDHLELPSARRKEALEWPQV